MPKTIKEIQTSVLDYGFNTSRYSSYILHWVDEAVRDMFREADLRIKHSQKEFNSVSGTEAYALPSDFGKSISLRDLSLTVEGELERLVTIEELDNANRTEGIPTSYIIDGSSIYLYPKPNVVRSYSLRYSIIPSEIAAEESKNPNIREDFYHLIEIYCLYKAFQKEGDIEMKNDYKSEYELGVRRFAAEMNTDTKDSTEQVEGAWGGMF